MTEPTPIAIVGAAGRMGTSLLEEAARRPDLRVVAAVVTPEWTGPDHLGPDQVPVFRSIPDLDEAAPRVVIDFTSPAAAIQVARFCAGTHRALVSGTTGLDDADLQELRRCAASAPTVWASNFSVGVNLLEALVEQATAAFGPEAEVEIFEAHHRHKVDAPSGTALTLGHAVARARGTSLESIARFTRQGHAGPRDPAEVGFQVLRGGDIVGEHSVWFCAHGERLELSHRATDRGIFARGALRAARWAASASPGFYSMRDVLSGPSTPAPASS